MKRNRISQREARRLKKRVAILEEREIARHRYWLREYPGGIHIGSVRADRDLSLAGIALARKLQHAVVAVPDEDFIKFFAVPLTPAD